MRKENNSVEKMSLFERFNREIETKMEYSVMIGFMTGLLFSGISWGIIYAILFLTIWEIIYAAYLNANGKGWDLDDRVTVILATFLGYLTGAIFHDQDDFHQHKEDFFKDMDKYGKDCGWF